MLPPPSTTQCFRPHLLLSSAWYHTTATFSKRKNLLDPALRSEQRCARMAWSFHELAATMVATSCFPELTHPWWISRQRRPSSQAPVPGLNLAVAAAPTCFPSHGGLTAMATADGSPRAAAASSNLIPQSCSHGYLLPRARVPSPDLAEMATVTALVT